MQIRSFGVEKEPLGTTFVFSRSDFDQRPLNPYDIPAVHPDRIHPRWNVVRTQVLLGLSRQAKHAIVYRWKVTIAGRAFFSNPRF